jgi:glycosyltransferase involved in cell wall biosynthesis
VKVAVVIPTYNRADRVAAGIESVLDQGADLSELVVVDDGSTDDTEVRVRPYLHRLKYVRTENRERGAARNTGARLTSSELVTFVDSDDRILPGHLRHAVEAFKRSPDAAAVYSDVIVEDDFGHVLRRGLGARVPGLRGREPVTTLIARYSNCMLAQGATIYRRSAFEAVGGFNEERELAGSEDYEFHVRLLARFPFVSTGQPTFAYRAHGDNTFDNVSQSERCIRASVRCVLENQELSRFSDLFPRMKAAAELQIAAVRLGSSDVLGCARALGAAILASPSIATDPLLARVALRCALGARGNRALRSLKRLYVASRARRT